MVFRFWYELSVGLLTLISILFFGEQGIKVIVLLALLPLIYRLRKIKPDERETQLFYKGTQYIVNIIVIVILASVFILKIRISDLTALSTFNFYLIILLILIFVSALRLYLHYKH